MPKFSSTNSYSERHIRRLRNKQTQFDLKRLNSGKYNIESKKEKPNGNSTFIKSMENDSDNESDESQKENFYNNSFNTNVVEVDKEVEIDDSINGKSKEEIEEDEKEEVEDMMDEEGEKEKEEEEVEEEEEEEHMFDFDFELEDRFKYSNLDSDSDENSNTSESSSSEEETEEESNNSKNKKFKISLCQWALLYNIPLIALTALLFILTTFTDYVLPRTARTLLKTPRKSNIVFMSDGGEYLHLGLNQAIESILKIKKFKGNIENNLNLYINIDGLPIHKASKNSLWLITCSDESSKSVYLIGAYYGSHHPTNTNEFLSKFVEDAKIVSENGFIFEGRKINVNIQGLICDAPAKSMVLNVKGHTGYYSCSKCKIKGEGILPAQNGNKKRKRGKKRRVCFPGIGPFQKRTDLEFGNSVYVGTYQKDKPTLLTDIPKFGAVSKVPLDYMHLVLLGVMRKLILLWLKGPCKVKLSDSEIDKISTHLMELRKSQPSDFSRKPRSLRDIKFWKATEFRNFLLYSGPIVLKDVLQEKKEQMYTNFMALHVALSILSSSIFIKLPGQIDYAQKLIEYFIQTFEIIYGKEFMSYNFHGLLHLCDDVKQYGPVDEFSAFKFENYMTTIKKKLRKHNKPLQQLARRYAEEQAFKEINISQSDVLLKHCHCEGPLIKNSVKIKKQYKVINNKSFSIDCNSSRNNCVLLQDGSIATISNIVELQDGNFHLIGKKYLSVGDLYTSPCNSSDYNINVISKKSDEYNSWPLSEVKPKLWKIPKNRKLSVVFPLLHTTSQ